ncbi:MAG: hypothetical protein VXZ82_08045 [Planctomycetota bacterium]|nr:hypothetical protein [Planctomycetota bacterium]
MLKTSLIRIVLRVAFTTLVTSNLTLKLAAHDHLDAHWSNEHIKTSCFTCESDLTPDVASKTKAWRHSLSSSYSLLRNGVSRLQNLFEYLQPFEGAAKLASQLPTQPADRQNELVVSKPLEGFAPRPKAKPLQLNYLYATHVGNWDEPYLPYDLAARDRHFGTRLELLAIRESAPEVSSEADFAPTEEQDLLSRFVAFAKERLLDPQWASFKRKIEGQAESILASVQSNGLRVFEGWSAPETSKPYFEQPSFVLLELEGGKQPLLKVEDALRWSFFQQHESVAVESASGTEGDLFVALIGIISKVNKELTEMAGFSVQKLKCGWSNVRDGIESWSAGLETLTQQMRMATQVRFYRGTRCLR